MPGSRFCPNCGSEDVEPDFSDAAYVGGAGGNPNTWKCKDCGFTGLMPEQGEESSEVEDKSDESVEIEFKPDEDYRRFSTDFGIGELKFYVYILIPAVLLYLVYLALAD